MEQRRRTSRGDELAANDGPELDPCELRTVYRGGRWWTLELVRRGGRGEWAVWLHREGHVDGWLWRVRGDALEPLPGDAHRVGPGCAWRRALLAPPYLVRLLEGLELRVGSPRVRPVLPCLIAANDSLAEVG